MNFNKQISNYKEYLLKVKMYSPFTIKNYLYSISILISFGKNNKIDILHLETSSYIKFLKYLSDVRKCSQESIKRHVAAIISFLTFLKIIKKKKDVIIVENVGNKKKRFRLPEYFTKEELTHILTSLDEEKFSINDRDKLIVYTLIFTGMRVSELINLKIRDIDLVSKSIYVLGKGCKERKIFIHPFLFDKLSAYFQKYTNSSKYLFVNKYKNKLSSRYIEILLKEIFKKINLSHLKVYPHKFRHTFATLLVSNSGNLILAKKLLGHTFTKTTEIYTHITLTKVKKDLSQSNVINIEETKSKK